MGSPTSTRGSQPEVRHASSVVGAADEADNTHWYVPIVPRDVCSIGHGYGAGPQHSTLHCTSADIRGHYNRRLERRIMLIATVAARIRNRRTRQTQARSGPIAHARQAFAVLEKRRASTASMPGGRQRWLLRSVRGISGATVSPFRSSIFRSVRRITERGPHCSRSRRTISFAIASAWLAPVSTGRFHPPAFSLTSVEPRPEKACT